MILCVSDPGLPPLSSIQVFTGAVPFNGKSSAAATFDIMSGTRPERPTHPDFTTELSVLMERCWNQDPHLRPAVSEVLNVLRGVWVSVPF